MARPERNNVDYFPFICEDGKKMYYIEETYGNDGFACFVKILRELAKAEFHYLDLSKPTTLMFLSAKCKVTKETLTSIIKDLCDLGKFDAMLWDENKVIWCQDFVDSIQDAYIKRKNKCITFEGLLSLLCSLGVRKPIKNDLKDGKKTQSIVEYSIEYNSRNNKRFTPPTLSEVLAYFEENGYTKQSGEKAFKYYETGNWKDSSGKQVKNWKQKMQSVWFKPENELKVIDFNSAPHRQNIYGGL